LYDLVLALEKHLYFVKMLSGDCARTPITFVRPLALALPLQRALKYILFIDKSMFFRQHFLKYCVFVTFYTNPVLHIMQGFRFVILFILHLLDSTDTFLYDMNEKYPFDITQSLFYLGQQC
jgi:hypothetical protein